MLKTIIVNGKPMNDVRVSKTNNGYSFSLSGCGTAVVKFAHEFSKNSSNSDFDVDFDVEFDGEMHQVTLESIHINFSANSADATVNVAE